MPKTAAFEKYSDAYEQWFDKNREVYAAELEAIRRLLPSPLGAGMEVGVGTGKFAAPLGIPMGVEPSEQMAVKARSRGLSVYPGIAEALPFVHSCFDVVLMVTTICFIDDPDQAVREAFRVLKPGGCLVLGFVDKDSELGRRYEKNRDKSRFYQEAVFFSTQEILRLIAGAGFCVEETHQVIITGEPATAIWEGSGRGAFVAVKGIKPAAAR